MLLNLKYFKNVKFKRLYQIYSDYPKKGILFRDITTLIKDENAFAETINLIIEKSKKFSIF